MEEKGFNKKRARINELSKIISVYHEDYQNPQGVLLDSVGNAYDELIRELDKLYEELKAIKK